MSRDKAPGGVFPSFPQLQPESRKWRGRGAGEEGSSQPTLSQTPLLWARRASGVEGRGGGAEPHLQVPIDNEAVVHVLQAQDDLGRVEAHVGLGENPVLGQVVVQVPA